MEYNFEDFPITKNIEVEFEGISSGDHESFCWDVTEEVFIKIKGEKPKERNKSCFNKGLFRIYPNDFYGLDSPLCKVKISINIL